jgi:uncharacterized protein YjbI with pentapeptide repeats
MASKPVQRRGTAAGPRPPAGPRLPEALAPASLPEHDLEDEANLHQLDFTELDLGGREADRVEFDQCGFVRAALADTVLDRARFNDCSVEHSDWANLKANRSTMQRVRLATVRLTGMQWVDGVLRDVSFDECRMDFATLRFTACKDVAFTGCNLAKADFTSADLRGAQFTDCDLTGAAFAQAQCTGARFVRCELAGIGNVAGLAGATVAASDLVALTHLLAGALGITIEAT